eukprot:10905577-Ditylum_brightwellii.AAC.1
MYDDSTTHSSADQSVYSVTSTCIIQLKDELFSKDWLHSHATKILSAKDEFINVIGVVNRQDHLTQIQKNALLSVLPKHQQMFDDTLGRYPHKKCHININPEAKSVYSRPYSIPHIYLSTFKGELEHLVKFGVLALQNESEWASPTFIISKKDGRIQWISDLRQLNIVVKHK